MGEVLDRYHDGLDALDEANRALWAAFGQLRKAKLSPHQRDMVRGRLAEADEIVVTLQQLVEAGTDG